MEDSKYLQRRAVTEARIAPPEVLTGITTGTMIMTVDGALPVQFLSPYDLIITRSGARSLRSLAVNVIENAQMVRISPRALGADRPEAEMFIAAGQEVLLRDWRARMLYQKDNVFVPAHRLADGEYICSETIAEARLFTLRFAQDEVIYAGGLELACRARQHKA